MADGAIPIRIQTARLLGVKGSQGQGTLLLYPDKLVHVHSAAIRWAASTGFAVVAAVGYAIPPHIGPGGLGALIGSGGGSLIGPFIARRRAAAEVAAGSGDVTVIPLDTITSLATSKPAGIGGWLGRRSVLVTTEGGRRTHSA